MARGEDMKSYRIRIYEDVYLIDDESGVGTKVVEYGNLEAAVALVPAKAKRAYPKGTRKRGPNKPKEPAAQEA